MQIWDRLKEAEENIIYSDGSRFEILEKMDSFCFQFLILIQEELEHLNSSITRAQKRINTYYRKRHKEQLGSQMKLLSFLKKP